MLMASLLLILQTYFVNEIQSVRDVSTPVIIINQVEPPIVMVMDVATPSESRHITMHGLSSVI